MKRVNKLFECPMSDERVLLSPSSHLRNLFSVGTEIFLESWMFSILTIMFCFLFVFHYGFVHIGYWVLSFISDYISPIHNLISGKEL